MAARLIFCVEGGGTKSRARLVDCAGEILAEAEAGPCNPSTGLDRAVASFITLWRRCAAAIDHDTARRDDVALSIGAAGLYVTAARADFLAAIPRFADTTMMSDGYAALIGAGGGQPCGLMIIGTGVAGHRLWPNGLSEQRDAWGWIAGDRGSGAWLGIRALRHAFAVIDGVCPTDGLSERVLATAGGRDRLAEAIRGATPDRLAVFAPVVLDAAAAGVPRAREIRDRAIEHLAALARTLDIGPGDTLYAAGGLAAIFAPWIGDALGHEIVMPARDALHGCYLVAAGHAPEERLRLEASELSV